MAGFGFESRSEINDESVSGHLVTILAPMSAASEAYRTLRTNILFAQVDAPPKVIAVTSPYTAEGKSTICANLGVVLAHADKNTLIVDCDFRRPVMHDIFGLGNTRGIADVLTGACALEEVVKQPLPDLSLKVLPVGALPPNPVEILSSRRLSELFAVIRDEYDYVLVDTPPVRLVSDAIVLSTQVDGVLLTLDTHISNKREVRRTIRALESVGATILGTVLNNIKDSQSDYRKGHLSYG